MMKKLFSTFVIFKSKQKYGLLLLFGGCLWIMQVTPAKAQMVVSDPPTEVATAATAGATTATAASTTAMLVAQQLEWIQINGLLANLNSSLHLNMLGDAKVVNGANQSVVDAVERQRQVGPITTLAAAGTMSKTSIAGCSTYAANYRNNAQIPTEGITNIAAQVKNDENRGGGTNVPTTPQALNAAKLYSRCGKNNSWSFDTTLCQQQHL